MSTDRVDWSDAYGNELGCPEISSIPLYWEPTYSEFDGKLNFNNYKQIGGWVVPYSKVYTTGKVCGSDLAQIYFEEYTQ